MVKGFSRYSTAMAEFHAPAADAALVIMITGMDAVAGYCWSSSTIINPFNPSTTIRFSLPEKCAVRLAVYSLLGEEIAVLTDATLTPSTYTATWNGRDSHGMEVTSGTYLIRLKAGDKQFVRKALLLR